MAAQAGRALIFEWNGAEIDGVREKGVAINGEPIDITSDENDGWRTLLDVAGQNQIDISISGVTKENTLKQEFFNGNRTRTATIEYANGDVLTGTFFLASYTDTGTYNESVTFEATLQSTGAVTFTPYA